MKTSSDKILSTHVGSLPRPDPVAHGLFARENEQPHDPETLAQAIKVAVSEAVAAQIEAGIDVVSDGEMSKISYATYIKDRITGFDGDSQRDPPSDLEAFPRFLERQANSGNTPTYRRPCCVGAIAPKDMGPLKEDLANFKAAVDRHQPREGFMNAASPGVIALFQPNHHYPDHEQYLLALAEAMRHEYEAIVEAGFVLQLDSPDLGLGRHMMFKGRPTEEYQQLAQLHVEVLNHSLRNIPSSRLRLHVCWGNYEGPHHHDAPMEVVLPIALAAKPQALLFESSNPRHAHEWEVFEQVAIPEDKILVPGVIDSTTNFIEHPRLVAQRLLRFADIVGRERVMAGSDCGFATFAGFGAVDPDIAYAKLKAMSDGAALATAKLWGRPN